MALDLSNLTNPYGQELAGIERNRALAAALMQGGQQQPQGQMISGRYVAPSFAQNLNPLLQTAVGLYGQSQADKSQVALTNTIQQKQAELLKQYGEAKSPSEQFAVASNPYAPDYLKATIPDMFKLHNVPEGASLQRLNLGTGAMDSIATGGMKVAPELRQAMQQLGINKPLEQLSPQELQAVNNKIEFNNRSKANNVSLTMPSESERKAGFMANILDSNLAQMQKAYQLDPKSVKPNVPSSIVEGISGPNVLSRNLSSTQRQIVEDSQLDVLDAALTLRTGAAYTKEQLKGMKDTYFPRALDSKDVVDAKKARLESLLNGAYIASGRATPKRVSEPYADTSPPPAKPSAPAQIDPKLLQFMTPEQQALFGVKK